MDAQGFILPYGSFWSHDDVIGIWRDTNIACSLFKMSTLRLLCWKLKDSVPLTLLRNT